MSTPSVDRLLARLRRSGSLTPTRNLYAEGIRAKLRQADFSLDRTRALEHVVPTPGVHQAATATQQLPILSVTEEVQFYCECLWDSLRSSLDILGQLVNDVASLGVRERKADFKLVYKKVVANQPTSVLRTRMDRCRKSEAFKQLEAYRHCSTHRRQVYVETKTTWTEGTPGYQFSGTIPSTSRYLCENPWDVIPVVAYDREVGPHSEWLLARISWHVASIVNAL